MDQQFLANSATMDGNDLSSVVGHGEHWCVCAWAFASAVDRDPTSIEGLQLMCEESNSKLREVYQPYICLLYTSPSPRDRTRSRMPSSA